MMYRSSTHRNRFMLRLLSMWAGAQPDTLRRKPLRKARSCKRAQKRKRKLAKKQRQHRNRRKKR